MFRLMDYLSATFKNCVVYLLIGIRLFVTILLTFLCIIDLLGQWCIGQLMHVLVNSVGTINMLVILSDIVLYYINFM